jgi:flavin reductase (DIM6/NTAB) family NADH-FMN oxidoreductase RutF
MLQDLDGDDGIALFKQAMSRVASTVALVTTGEPGSRNGFTATSYCSLSASPASILVCVSRTTTAHEAIATGGSFGLSILGRSENQLANEFAGLTGKHGEERFASRIWFQSSASVPLLARAVAGLDCVVANRLDEETHTIVVAKVRKIYVGGLGDPLLYFGRSFAAPMRSPAPRV